jgi:hypothetical protein
MPAESKNVAASRKFSTVAKKIVGRQITLASAKSFPLFTATSQRRYQAGNFERNQILFVE